MSFRAEGAVAIFFPPVKYFDLVALLKSYSLEFGTAETDTPCVRRLLLGPEEINVFFL